MTTGTNQFVPFATGTGANVYSNADYSGLTARSTGVANGVADPKAANNAWRQGSVMAAAIGRFISLMGYDALDDGDITTLEEHFEAALAAKIAGGQAVIPTASLIHVGADTGTVNAIVADVTPDVSSWVDGQVYVIRPANTTTSTAPTFKPDALAAKTIVHPDGSALLVGEIVGGAKCILIYDSTLDKVVLVCTRAYVDQSIVAAVNDTHLFASNGYQRLPSGLIIQWGAVTATVPGETPTAYSFPMTFPHACLNVTATGRYNGNLQDMFVGMSLDTAPTTSGFTVYAINPNSPYPSLPGFYWFAIGY